MVFNEQRISFMLYEENFLRDRLKIQEGVGGDTLIIWYIFMVLNTLRDYWLKTMH